MKRIVCFLLGGHRWYLFFTDRLPCGIGINPVGVCMTCGERRS